MIVLFAHGGLVPHLHADGVAGLIVLLLAMVVVVAIGRRGVR
jgi:hypothetical protein